MFKRGLRVDVNACDLRILFVGYIYLLDTVEAQVPLWSTLYSLPKIPVIYMLYAYSVDLEN